MYKEYSEFAALIGFFLLFIPLILLLSKLPFFKNIYTKKPEPLPTPKTNGGKLANYILIIIGGLFPALFFAALYSGDVTGMRLLRQISMILIASSAIFLIYSYLKKTDKTIKACSMIMLILSLIQYIFLRFQDKFIATTEFFASPTTNPIAYWAINVAIVIVMMLVCNHYVSKKTEGATIANYGVKASAKSVFASLIVAVVSIVIGYAILYIVDAVFATDFRIWTIAVKTFEEQHLIALLKYAPLFYIFYFTIGISANMNTTGAKYEGIKGYIISIFHFVGGLILYLGYHYGLLFITGTAGYPEQALSSILVIALVPLLTVAAIYNRFLYRKTGNVYVAAFLNTLLITLITLANSALYTNF